MTLLWFSTSRIGAHTLLKKNNVFALSTFLGYENKLSKIFNLNKWRSFIKAATLN
jgi:hypothetical protein